MIKEVEVGLSGHHQHALLYSFQLHKFLAPLVPLDSFAVSGISSTMVLPSLDALKPHTEYP